MGKERLEMFSDGVFAIAITILVLEIKIPKHDDLIQWGGLFGYLTHIWPTYVAYIVSFLMIGIYWSNHHHLFLFMIKKTNHFFNLINVGLLMAIALMPFTTAIFSDYFLLHEYSGQAVTVYIVGLIPPQIACFFLFLYGKIKKGIFDPDLSPTFINKQLIKLIIATIFTTSSLILSYFHPMSALAITGLSFLMYFMPPDMPEYIGEEKKHE